MARVRLKLTPTAGATKAIRQAVQRRVSPRLLRRAQVKAPQISTQVGNYLASVFNQTEVARSLRGAGSVDLQAHFGLSADTANALVDGMAGIIRNSVRIRPRQFTNVGRIEIRAVPRDWTNYTKLPGAIYLSQPSGIPIPVVEWMLVDPNIDIGQAAYDIVFKGEAGQEIDSRIEKVSRSGRAIMVSLDSLGGTGSSYVLPDIVRGHAGQNFIEYTLGQQGVLKQVSQKVMGVLF